MFKFVLMTGVFLGSLAGMSGAVQAIESGAKPFRPAQVSAEKDKGEQALGSAMAMAQVYRKGDAVYVYIPHIGGPSEWAPGRILAVHSGQGTYQVRIYLLGEGDPRGGYDTEMGPQNLRPR